MNAEWQRELQAAIWSGESLEKIVALLRQYKDNGVNQEDMYTALEGMRRQAPDETVEDRVLEVADFVAGFCSPHMRVWES